MHFSLPSIIITTTSNTSWKRETNKMGQHLPITPHKRDLLNPLKDSDSSAKMIVSLKKHNHWLIRVCLLKIIILKIIENLFSLITNNYYRCQQTTKHACDLLPNLLEGKHHWQIKFQHHVCLYANIGLLTKG